MLKADLGFLKLMAENYAVTYDGSSKDVCAVYARGDRRCRPMGWLTRSDLDALYQHGHLKRLKKGYGFSYATERALIEGRWTLACDIHIGGGMSETLVYVPSGVQRSVRKRNNSDILKRLARERGPNQHAFLSSHEVQAGELFQLAYAKCLGYQRQGGQSFDCVHVDSSRENSAEHRAAIHIDMSRDFEKAKSVLGPGLEQAALVICGEGKSLDVLERELEWSRGSGRMILKLALQRLARYYGTVPGESAEKTPMMMV